MQSEKLKGNLDMLLLSVLSAGPGHGYSIITRLRDRSAGAFDLPEGTVYPALHRLEQTGLLASSWEVAAGRKRRIYRLTLVGERSLAEEARQWQAFSGSILLVLGGSA
jgi:PadR family transcriptional regulator, regulatory protein PadR